MPEVGLSGLALDYPNSGSAVYTRNLIQELPAAAPDLRFHLFRRWSRASHVGMTDSRLASPLAPLNRGRGAGARLDKLAWEVGSLPVAALLRREALLHSTYFAIPVVSAVPVVVTVHDVIPLVLPGYHRSRQAELYSRLMAWSVPRAADAIITVSHHARDDIIRCLKVDPERVHVTHEAVDSRFTPDHAPVDLKAARKKYQLPERFVLYMGGAERRKNVEVLLRAWARRSRSFADRQVKLVIVARLPEPDDLYPDLVGLATSLNVEREVIFIPEVDEWDKPAVFASALLFCFPSMYEGFGLPPLEAMASGVPTLSADATSLPEVVGDGAVLLPPLDAEAWASTIEHYLDSHEDRRSLSRRGMSRARQFSWAETARATVSVYRSVLGA